MKITLKVWRQKNASSSGGFKSYQSPELNENMSFLEMLDVVNEELANKGEERAPISWLRQAAAEIEAKKRNPNPEGTRHSNNHSTSHTSSPYAMSEGPSGKLQQKDFTPEVDELLPQATALAQVESLQASSRSHL